jgi:hypothetical protein
MADFQGRSLTRDDMDLRAVVASNRPFADVQVSNSPSQVRTVRLLVKVPVKRLIVTYSATVDAKLCCRLGQSESCDDVLGNQRP